MLRSGTFIRRKCRRGGNDTEEVRYGDSVDRENRDLEGG